VVSIRLCGLVDGVAQARINIEQSFPVCFLFLVSSVVLLYSRPLVRAYGLLLDD